MLYFNRRIPVFALLIVALTALACFCSEIDGLERFTSDYRQTFDWVADKTLDIFETKGSVFIRAAKDENIHLDAMKTAFARDLETARRESLDTRISVLAPADRIKIAATPPPHLDGIITGRVDYDIKVPGRIPLKLETVSGGIDIDATDGPLSAKTVSGDIVVSDITGPIDIETITGNVELYDCPETLHVKTHSGNINYDSDGITAPGMKLESLGGNISVILPKNSNVTYSIKTVSGKIDTSYAELETVEESDREPKLKCGDGSIFISVTTVSGDITIETF